MKEIRDKDSELAPRRVFIGRLRRHMQLATEKGLNLGLVVVDINDFTGMNAHFGFDVGDEVLAHVAAQMAAARRARDYVGQLDGDRFALLIPLVDSLDAVGHRAADVLERLEKPFTSASANFVVPVTLGYSMSPRHGGTGDVLLSRAEDALKRARAAGKTIMVAKAPGDDAEISAMWDVEMEMGDALKRNAFSLTYLPKIRASDMKVMGAEALLRWDSRSRGEISPAVFVPLAARIGKLRELTLWSLRQALKEAATWPQGDRKVDLAVNLAPEEFEFDDLPALVEETLEAGSPQLRLTLEVADRTLADDLSRKRDLLRQLQDLGCRIALDDFGTGYTNLAQFQDFPVDELKIDADLVRGLGQDAGKLEVAKVVIDLAHRFGLAAVAEGVEDKRSLLALKANGCDFVQGYFFGEPRTSEALVDWLEAGQVMPKSGTERQLDDRMRIWGRD